MPLGCLKSLFHVIYSTARMMSEVKLKADAVKQDEKKLVL